MMLAVDIGTSEFRSLAREGRRLVGRRCAACYVAIPADAATGRWIDRMQVPTLECDGSRIVIGEAAIELSRLLHLPLIPMLADGRIPAADPIGRQLVAVGIESVVPPKGRYDEVLMTIPGDDVDPDAPEAAFLSRLFRAKGPLVRFAHSGTATAHATLRTHRYSGLAINLGAGFCSTSLVRLGLPLVEMTIAVGSRWIDDRFARTRSRHVFDRSGRKFLDLFGIEAWKRTIDLRSDPKQTPDLSVLRDLYREVAVSLARKLETELAASRHARTLTSPLPILLAGGGAAMGGFDEILRSELGRITLPFPTGPIEHAAHDPFTVARGLLLLRESGQNGLLRRAA